MFGLYIPDLHDDPCHCDVDLDRNHQCGIVQRNDCSPTVATARRHMTNMALANRLAQPLRPSQPQRPSQLRPRSRPSLVSKGKGPRILPKWGPSYLQFGLNKPWRVLKLARRAVKDASKYGGGVVEPRGSCRWTCAHSKAHQITTRNK
mgnify:CR=1 FL=1